MSTKIGINTEMLRECMQRRTPTLKEPMDAHTGKTEWKQRTANAAFEDPA